MPLGIPQSWAEANSLYSLILESAQNPASLRGGCRAAPQAPESSQIRSRGGLQELRWLLGWLPGSQARPQAPRLRDCGSPGRFAGPPRRQRREAFASNRIRRSPGRRSPSARAHQHHRTLRSPGRRSSRAGARAEAETFHDTLSSACGGTPRVEHESTTKSACGRTLQAGSASPP